MLGGNNIHYELSERVRGIPHGGIGAIHMLVTQLGLIQSLHKYVKLLKQNRPYHESDHILNIAYNILCGGKTLDDIELLRNDLVHLDALGVQSIPDPTTAGDFCRRFEPETIQALQDAINWIRLKVWKSQPSTFTEKTARIDTDGSLVGTLGECKEGMDISYHGIWGYHPGAITLYSFRWRIRKNLCTY